MRRIFVTMLAGWVIWVVDRSRCWQPKPTRVPAAMGAAARWPTPTNVSRPWTRWWWLGSAVDAENLTRLLETYHAAGLGGVEITSIYGVQGADERELQFLSRKWVDALRHAVREAKRLGMGVDLPTGSGWRTGGPSVTEADANAELVLERESLSGGRKFRRTFERRPQAIVAYGDDGEYRRAHQSRCGRQRGMGCADRRLDALHREPALVEGQRQAASPRRRGQEHQSALAAFARALSRPTSATHSATCRPREFAPSFTIRLNTKAIGATISSSSLRRDADTNLQHHLPALDGEGDPDDVARVKHDYRETVSDLILENLIEPWTAWSHEHGMISRNQSHGSPANWLDLYAACDIPETESFGRLVGGDTNRLVFMFASSAAHVAGKPLGVGRDGHLDQRALHGNAWRGERDCRPIAFGRRESHRLSRHGLLARRRRLARLVVLRLDATQSAEPDLARLLALNEYVTRCQAMLQSTRPDNDILLYWPIHDYWRDPRGLRKNIQVHNSGEWLDGTEFERTAKWLDEHGYTFDYISDRQLVR